MVIGKNGVLYGTTGYGGTSNLGTVFKVVPPASPGGSWTEGVLYDFTSALQPDFMPGVVIGSGGVLYGTTYSGGTSTACEPIGCGTVFSLTPPTSRGGTWTETVLHDFTGTNGVLGSPDGATPLAALVVGTNGVLYGTTVTGGASFAGTVFELSPPVSPGGTWTETVLHSFSFSDGFGPEGSLVIGTNGVLYGTTLGGGTSTACSGGCGTVFELTPPTSPGGIWTETVLYSFAGQPDGFYPEGSLVIGTNGVLYGITNEGGTSNLGTVFELMPPTSPGGNWTETVLYSFVGQPDGKTPTAGVVVDTNGVLYGTTFLGGTSNSGTVFALTPPPAPGGAWTEAVLYDFTGGSDGYAPAGGLVIGTNGVFYGTTASGGSTGNGTVFSFVPPHLVCGVPDLTSITTVIQGLLTAIAPTDQLWSQSDTVTNNSSNEIQSAYLVLIGEPTRQSFIPATEIITHCFSSRGDYIMPVGTIPPENTNGVPLLWYTTVAGASTSISYRTRVLAGLPNK